MRGGKRWRRFGAAGLRDRSAISADTCRADARWAGAPSAHGGWAPRWPVSFRRSEREAGTDARGPVASAGRRENRPPRAPAVAHYLAPRVVNRAPATRTGRTMTATVSEYVDPSFYGEPKAAAMKAIGLP
jgi:hypothetical protein